MCFQREAVPVAPAQTPVPTASATRSTDTRLMAVEADVDTLQADNSQLDQDVSTAKQDIQSMRTQLSAVQVQTAQLANDVTSLSQSVTALRNELGPKVTNALAGQAVLMQGLNVTQQELSQVKEGLTAERFLTYVFFILLIIAIALGIGYYITRMHPKINPDVYQYITKNIKDGKKFPVIRESLRQAGWAEEEITIAYKETIKKNYQQYRQQSTSRTTTPAAGMVMGAAGAATRAKAQSASSAGGAQRGSTSATSAASNRNKIISIVVVSLLLLGGVFFLLSGTVGKAIYTQRLVGGVEGGRAGVVEYTVDCTPPHILTPTKDSCCLDEKTRYDNGTLGDAPNGICDTTEERAMGELQGSRCTDNNQCGGEYCIDNTCRSLATIYKGSPQCDKMCNYYSVRIGTSDGETYSIKPNKGSYTAAGALEWKVLSAPDHCEGERVVIPLMITTKDTGNILGERIITLREGEKSDALTHPTIPHISFKLKVSSVFELCNEI